MRLEANVKKNIRENIRKNRKKNINLNCIPGKYESLIASFIFPILICCVGFALMGVYPFGSRSALIIDGVHQYIGFYKEFFKQIVKGGNWTFSAWGMGHDFYSIFSYYLSSPFSLLILLLMKFLYVNEAVTIVVLLKIGLAASCMTWYVQKKTEGENIIAICMGCAYGLSNYMLGYYSNLMWLDCVILLPVLAWSIERLIYEGRWKMYTVTLAYCILSNYYFGFMLCVFSVLYYMAVYWGMGREKDRRTNDKINKKTNKKINEKRDSWYLVGLKFIGASLMSGGIAAIIIVPAIFAIMETTAASQTGILLNVETYGNIWTQFKKLLFDSYAYATSGDQGSVNIYCGCAIVLFSSLYFFNRQIYWKKKVAMAALVLFYFAGFHFKVLNFFLHGMHKPTGMPNRFSFIVVFLLLNIGSEGWKKAEWQEKILQIAGVMVALLFCGMIEIKTGDANVTKSIWLLLVYFTFILGINVFRRKNVRIVCNILIAIVFLGEIGMHGILSIHHTGSAHRNLYEESGQELTRFMSMKKDRARYRADIINPMLRNEELLYNLNGIAMFSSTNVQSMQKWMWRMGFETSKNRFQYTGGTEVMDMLLGIKYLVCRKNIVFDTAYKKINSGAHFNLYQNARALANAYLVNVKMKNFRLKGNNPMEVQNNLLKDMGCGMLYQLNIIKPQKYQFETDGSAYEIKVKGGQHGYVWLMGAEPSVVDLAGRIQDYRNWNNNFLDLGYAKEDRIVRINTSSTSKMAVLGTFTEKQINAVYQKLRQNQIWLQDGKGEITTKQKQVLYIPVFYNKGLQVQIDGQKEKVLNLDGMTGVLIPKGSHNIKFIYETRGFWLGTAISIASILIFVSASYMESYLKSKKRVKNRKRHKTKSLLYLE